MGDYFGMMEKIGRANFAIESRIRCFSADLLNNFTEINQESHKKQANRNYQSNADLKGFESRECLDRKRWLALIDDLQACISRFQYDIILAAKSVDDTSRSREDAIRGACHSKDGGLIRYAI